MQTVKPDIAHQALDNQEILQYLEGKLPAARKDAIDAIIAKDPFLADAIEGLAYVKDPIARANAIKEIQQNVFAKTGAKLEGRSAKLNYGAISGVAALLVVAISSFFLIRHYAFQKDEKIAKLEQQAPSSPTNNNKTTTPAGNVNSALTFSEEKDNKPISLQKSDSGLTAGGTYAWTSSSGAISTPGDANRNEVALSEDKKSAAPVATGTAYYTDQTLADKAETKSKNSKPGIIKGQVIDAGTGAPISGARVFVQGKQSTLTSANGNYELALEPGTYEIEYSQTGYEDQGKKIAVKADEQQPVRLNVNMHKGFDGYTSNVDKEQEVVNANKPSPNDFKQGIDEYSKGQYKQARVTLDKAISSDPANIDAVYYAGLSYYNSYSPGKSIAYFDKVIKSGSKYKDDAQWYKAQALMQKGLKDEAKKVLSDISAGKSKYKDRAAKALTDY